jgi:hypothetical protein
MILPSRGHGGSVPGSPSGLPSSLLSELEHGADPTDHPVRDSRLSQDGRRAGSVLRGRIACGWGTREPSGPPDGRASRGDGPSRMARPGSLLSHSLTRALRAQVERRIGPIRPRRGGGGPARPRAPPQDPQRMKTHSVSHRRRVMSIKPSRPGRSDEPRAASRAASEVSLSRCVEGVASGRDLAHSGMRP